MLKIINRIKYIITMYNKVIVKFIHILNKLLNTVHTPAFLVNKLMKCLRFTILVSAAAVNKITAYNTNNETCLKRRHECELHKHTVSVCCNASTPRRHELRQVLPTFSQLRSNSPFLLDSRAARLYSRTIY
jgi:hypothetical protein